MLRWPKSPVNWGSGWGSDGFAELKGGERKENEREQGESQRVARHEQVPLAGQGIVVPGAELIQHYGFYCVEYGAMARVAMDAIGVSFSLRAFFFKKFEQKSNNFRGRPCSGGF